MPATLLESRAPGRLVSSLAEDVDDESWAASVIVHHG